MSVGFSFEPPLKTQAVDNFRFELKQNWANHDSAWKFQLFLVGCGAIKPLYSLLLTAKKVLILKGNAYSKINQLIAKYLGSNNHREIRKIVQDIRRTSLMLKHDLENLAYRAHRYYDKVDAPITTRVLADQAKTAFYKQTELLNRFAKNIESAHNLIVKYRRRSERS